MEPYACILTRRRCPSIKDIPRILTKSVHTRYGLPTYMLCFFYVLSFCVCPLLSKGTLINLASRNVHLYPFEVKHRSEVARWSEVRGGEQRTVPPKKRCICSHNV